MLIILRSMEEIGVCAPYGWRVHGARFELGSMSHHQFVSLADMRIQAGLLALFVVASTSFAQSFTPVRELKNLSPEAIAKLHTLESLNALPAEQWRFHAGDLPHGESVSLDDSSWTVAQKGQSAPKEAVWYRSEIVVPKTLRGYDISGSQILFQFKADANGPMPEIVYFNGRRVALGDDLEPITLFPDAKPGEKVLVAVKLLQTVDEKKFRGAVLSIVPGGIGGASARPSVEDVRVQIISAANLLPELTPSRRDLLPVVEKAVDAINMKALADGEQATFDRSLRRAQEILGQLHDAMATAKIDMAGNSHIDAAWLWPKTETVDVVKRTFTTALQLMNEYPTYTFSQSAAQYTEWMADKYPDLNAQIKQRVQEGRWEIVGGMWVEPDLNIPDGESLVRQLLVGQRVFQKDYGVTARIGWNPDSFGYNWQLPQIYKRSGLDYFVTQKMHWNDTNQLPFRLFWWESPDGSKVLTYFPTDYTHRDLSPTRLTADFAESAERNPGTTEMLDLYGIGDHGGGPTREILDQGDHWVAEEKNPESAVPDLRFRTAQSYFDDVQTKLNPDSPTWDYDKLAKGWTAPAAGAGTMGVPTWKDELYFEYHRGIYTTQAAHKNGNRRSEVETLDAEKLASMAWLQSGQYPADSLTESWKKITFNQFHDLAAGSGIAVIYRDAAKEYAEVASSDREISAGAMDTLDAGIDTHVKSGVPVIVTNAMAWPRSATVSLHVQLPETATSVRVLDAKNHPLLSQVTSTNSATHEFSLLARVENVPALGYTVIHVEPTNSSNAEKSDLHLTENPDNFVLTNRHLAVTIDRKTGCLTSLVSGGKEFIASGGCANQLQTFVDTPKRFDAWNIDPGTLDTMTPITEVDSVATTMQTPLRETVRVSRTWQQSKFQQDISLDADADEVKVDNVIDWHETHVLLKAAFPLAAAGPKATFEIPYGSIERATTRNNSFEKARFEVPALRWADLGDAAQGMSLLNDSKYGYDAVGNLLRLTLLRSPTWPDPEADRGMQRFEYVLYPHAGSWKDASTMRRGYELNDALKSQQVFSHEGTMPQQMSWGAIDNPNVTLTAVKKAEDSDALVYRMYEWAGKDSIVSLHIAPGATYVVESNLMEKVEGPHLTLKGDVVSVPIKPYEILTVQAFYPAKPVK
jgi:alpha-mannosidase